MVAKTGAASGLTFVRKFPRKLVSVLFLSRQTGGHSDRNRGVCVGVIQLKGKVPRASAPIDTHI